MTRLSPRSGSQQCFRPCFMLSILMLYVWTRSMSSSVNSYKRWVVNENRPEGTASLRKTSDANKEVERPKLNTKVALSSKDLKKVERPVPKVIWLLSFPNSGTTYTNKLVQEISETTTATNYGKEQSGYKTSIPISPDHPNGPFLRFPEQNYSKYVLTKSHCTGYCIRCTPERYVLNTEKFEIGCRSGNKMVDGKAISTQPAYSSDLPKKVVHIIRNPFDNIVARLHMQRKNWEAHGDHEQFLELFQNDKDGFRKWCKFLDFTQTIVNSESKLLDNTTKELFFVSPCAAEFYRYVQWHNLAIELSKKQLNLPIYTLFYENYTENFDGTVDQLLNFLELTRVSTPPPFVKGKEYPDYFTGEERLYIAELVRHLATNESWALLQHYFDGYLES